MRFIANFRIAVLSLGLLAAGQAAAADLVLSTQPRGPRAEVDKPFDELAAYLGRIVGTPVRYRYIDDWLSYATEMQKGYFDIVFDGPAFVSWRMRSQGHEVLVKVAGAKIQHHVVVKKENATIKSMNDLIGRRVCGRPVPNLSALELLKEFPNPTRQPYIQPADSYGEAFRKMIEGRCEAAVVSVGLYRKLNEGGIAREIFTTEPLPPAAITAGPRVTPEQKRRIVEALTSPDAVRHIGAFLKKYAGDKPFEIADPAMYRPHHILLKNEWGFGENAPSR